MSSEVAITRQGRAKEATEAKLFLSAQTPLHFRVRAGSHYLLVPSVGCVLCIENICRAIASIFVGEDCTWPSSTNPGSTEGNESGLIVCLASLQAVSS